MYLMRDNLNDDYGFLKLQNKILEIMSYVDKLCRDNDIDYCLMGGSALGAKRHGGFIPWDDDLDIFMTPDNYDKFVRVFKESGDKKKFYLQEWGLTDKMVTISKIRLNNSTYIESILKNMDIHQGIYIDIFILHTCPNNRISQLHQCFWAKYAIMKGLAIRNYDRRKGWVGRILALMRTMPDKFLLKHALKQVYKYRGKNTKYYCNFMGKAFFKKGIYKKEWFVPTRDCSFENIILKVPGKLEDFLSERFGDYMKIPSPEQIKWEQHAEYWNTDVDYQTYLGRKCNFKDEIRLI